MLMIGGGILYIFCIQTQEFRNRRWKERSRSEGHGTELHQPELCSRSYFIYLGMSSTYSLHPWLYPFIR